MMLTPGVSVGEGHDGTPFFDNRDAGASVYKLDPATAVANRRELLLLSLRESTNRAPLAQEIFDEIAIAIVDGRLRPGQVLNSVELARRFGTSRTPVREALAGLERQGAVVVPPRRKPYVAPVTLRQIKDIYDLRASLFTLAAELIVDECPTERLAALWRWQEALEDDVARDAVEDYFWHNVGFRLLEVRLTGNEELQRTIAGLGIRTLQFRHVSLSQPVRLKESVAQHRRLLLAYDARDKATATDATRSMIMAGYRFLRKNYVVNESPGEVSTKDEEEPPPHFTSTQQLR